MNDCVTDLDTQPFVKGIVRQEIFFNEENQYGVYLLDVLESSDESAFGEIVVIGNILRLHVGDTYRCYGDWKHHAKFGRQLHFHYVKQEFPQTEQAIVKYLSSGLFKGIGKKIARNIVRHLGDKALEKILENPDSLKGVKGVNPKRAKMIADHLQQHLDLEKAMVFLYRLNLGSALATRVLQAYKEQTMKIVEENPYRLVDDIEGIGFQRADELALQQGFKEDSYERFQAAVLFLMNKAIYSNGHVFLYGEQLNQQIDALVGKDAFSPELRDEYVWRMSDDERILIEDDRYYLPSLYFSELGLARQVSYMLHQKMDISFSMIDFHRVLGEIEEEGSMIYSDQQQEAIQLALSSSLMILTGGPGTGKTTVIRGVCQAFARMDHNGGQNRKESIRLVAPTGRAAKRMSQATGFPAMTIHRLLGWKGGNQFERGSDFPIEGKLLIVDETSMLDIWLANKLFRAIPPGMQVILIGDQDQLPSVGPGSVLHHLLAVEELPRIQLTEVFRQAKDSTIIRLAHGIQRGEVISDMTLPQKDFRFFPRDSSGALSVILQTVENAIRKGYTLFDVQVIAPMYKGACGVDRINQEIQQMINPRKSGQPEIQYGENIFRLGDKVIQLTNHPEYPIYNGDMGIVVSINEHATADVPVLTVLYEGNTEVPYLRKQLNQISLAYACSVHKAQGSEFPIVIFPVLFAYRRMLMRNLIYTAVTRSKSCLIMCGEIRAFEMGIGNERTKERNCQLKDLIEEHLNGNDYMTCLSKD